MYYTVKNNKVVDDSRDLESELKKFIEEEESRVLRELLFKKELSEKAKVRTIKK